MSKYKRVEFCCVIGIKYEMRAACEKILERIARVDPTFRFSIYNSKFPQYDQVIIVSATSRDHAHHRGLLLCGKDEPGKEKRSYFPKEYNLTYWVKEVSHVKEQIA